MIVAVLSPTLSPAGVTQTSPYCIVNLRAHFTDNAGVRCPAFLFGGVPSPDIFQTPPTFRGLTTLIVGYPLEWGSGHGQP